VRFFLDKLENEEQIRNEQHGGVVVSLLARINRYLVESGIPPTRFGRMAVNDPRLVGDLQRGRRVGGSVIRRVESVISGGRA